MSLLAELRKTKTLNRKTRTEKNGGVLYGRETKEADCGVKASHRNIGAPLYAFIRNRARLAMLAGIQCDLKLSVVSEALHRF